VKCREVSDRGREANPRDGSAKALLKIFKDLSVSGKNPHSISSGKKPLRYSFVNLEGRGVVKTRSSGREDQMLRSLKAGGNVQGKCWLSWTFSCSLSIDLGIHIYSEAEEAKSASLIGRSKRQARGDAKMREPAILMCIDVRLGRDFQ
jgi:hypothetical protein